MWIAGAWQPAHRIQPGDVLRTVQGEVTVASVDVEHRDAQVWTLRVGAPHSYFAGGVWVHNY